MEFSSHAKFTTFLSVGSGGSGQLLQGDLEDFTSFKPIFSQNKSQPENPAIENFVKDIIEISLGGTKGLGLTYNGEVYAWGEDSGKPGEKIHIEPILKLNSPLKVTKISCGWAHNVCLTENNEVFVWGEGKFGQLGLGKDMLKNVSDPVQLPLEERIKIINVAAGFRQSYLIAESNQIVCFGSNKILELGQKTQDSIISSPIIINTFEKRPKIQKLEPGQRHVVILDELKELYGWGCSKYGQLGIQSEKQKAYEIVKLSLSNVKDFSCGWSHTMALTDDGFVYVTGRGNFGQQGNNSHEDSFDFHKIDISQIKKIIAGSEACHVITEEDEIYVWGWNEHGNLGVGDKKDRLSPVKLNIDCKSKSPELFCGGAALILALK